MGKKADFFMDDVSIFDNPANINIFPNFLIGELGAFPQNSSDSLSGFDPMHSWFGGIFSYSLGRGKSPSSLYPQLSIGGAFNRVDKEIFDFLPDSSGGYVIPDPVTNFDGYLGFTFMNGGMLGSHVYVALQEGANLKNGNIIGDFNDEIRLSIIRGDLGFNWPISRNVDGELSLGSALIGYGPSDQESKYSYFLKGRAFSTLELINGELVPIFNYTHLAVPGKTLDSYHLGLGANVSLDRGFFWIGFQGVLSGVESKGVSILDGIEAHNPDSDLLATSDFTGGIISFGIERNIWWDWLVIRVGGRKEIGYMEESGPGYDRQYFHTNPVGNGTAEDHVGLGIGINVEEKLKVDATLSEGLPYTLGNLFSRPQSRIISRISATYGF
jgi:hypothetical protein